MKINRKKLVFVLLTLIFIFALTNGAYAKPESLTLVSGVAGGTSFVQAEALSSIFRAQGVKSTVEPGGDAVNVMLVSDKRADIGITTSWIPQEAKEMKAPFDKKYENIAALAWIGSTISHIFVLENKGINSVADLKGKDFANQKVGSGSRIVFHYILGAYGMDEGDLSERLGGQTEQSQLMMDEHVVGLAATTTPPSGAFIQLTSIKNVKLLDLTEEVIKTIIESNPGFRGIVMPKGTYPRQDKDNFSIGGSRMFIVRKDMPDEDVYWIVKTFVENLDKFKAGHAAMKDLTLEKMFNNLSGIELHPGAKRYYDEVLGK